tara:strand:+ start:1079 stop:2839 length:1761 start_codon:yes stop_codon:yes gene_type:complete
MKFKYTLIISLALTSIHYLLSPSRFFWQPFGGLIINFIFLYGILFFQRFKYIRHISTTLFILTFIQLVYFFHYRSFIPLTAYEFILREPRMLQEVLIMAKAEYFILPVIIVFYIVSKGLKKLSAEKSREDKKPIIASLFLLGLLALLSFYSKQLDQNHVLPFSANYIAQTISQPLFPYEKKSIAQKDLKTAKGKVVAKKSNYNVIILLSDALRMDALSVAKENKTVVDKSLQSFYEGSLVFNFTVSPSNMTDSSMPSLVTSKSPFRKVNDFQSAYRMWDYFSSFNTFYLSTADVQFSSLDQSIQSQNLKFLDDLENINKSLPLLDILSNGDQLFLDSIISKLSPPFFGIWHMDGTHSYLYPPNNTLPKELKDFPDNKKRKYLHSVNEMSKTVKKIIDSVDLEKTIVVLTSDHGEGFGEHGAHFHYKDFHQESIRVPMIIHLPKSLKMSLSAERLNCLQSNTEKITSTLDLFPTLLSLNNISTSKKMDGVDLTKCIDKKRIVSSTNCLREYQCFNQDFMLASDDYYAIFSKKDGLIGIYDTWLDILQEKSLQNFDDQKLKAFKRSAIEFLNDKKRDDLIQVVDQQLP